MTKHQKLTALILALAAVVAGALAVAAWHFGWWVVPAVLIVISATGTASLLAWLLAFGLMEMWEEDQRDRRRK